MSLRIAFDCDGVIADMDSALEGIAEQLFGPIPDVQAETEVDVREPIKTGGAPPVQSPGSDEASVTAEEHQLEPLRVRRLTGRQQHDVWEAVKNTENFWETLQETEPGIVARLAKVADERGWEVIFVTQRPGSAGYTTQRQTQRWLVKHGFVLPSVYVTKGTRGKIAEALSLDVVVDDRPENCLDVKLESRARAILIRNGDPASIPPNARKLGIEPVAGIGACLDSRTAAPVERPGLLSRVKKLLGA